MKILLLSHFQKPNLNIIFHIFYLRYFKLLNLRLFLLNDSVSDFCFIRRMSQSSKENNKIKSYTSEYNFIHSICEDIFFKGNIKIDIFNIFNILYKLSIFVY